MNKQILEITEKGLIVRLRIIPNSSRNEIFLDGGILKVKITAQPIENKANKALIEFLSKTLKLAKSNIKIIKGDTSKEKTLCLSGIDSEQIWEKLKLA